MERNNPAAAPIEARDSLPRQIGRRILRALGTFQGLGAFGLITLGVLLTKLQAASQVVHPLMRRQIHRSVVKMLPMVLFFSGVLGLVVIGQTVLLLTRVGAQELVGTIMVTAVVRELGPAIAALAVLAQVGSATVIELATARALGEVEALEAMSIDPVHYLVVPRVLGMMLSVFTLTVYLILGSLASGWLCAFLQDVPLLPGAYLRQLAGALGWADFLLLALKTSAFGLVISVVTCYHGLARPLSLEDISRATVQAMVQGLVGCVLLDGLFILAYLLI